MCLLCFFPVCQLRACLGMQIVACAASIVNLICTLIKMDDMPFFCWHYYYDNSTLHYGETCQKLGVSLFCLLFMRTIFSCFRVESNK